MKVEKEGSSVSEMRNFSSPVKESYPYRMQQSKCKYQENENVKKDEKKIKMKKMRGIRDKMENNFFFYYGMG